MAARPQHRLTVASLTPLTPNMRQLVLTGPTLAAFPDGFEGGYVKFLLPQGSEPGARVAKRSYTVRAFDRERCELTLEVGTHIGPGPAARWLHTAAVGDPLEIAGPGPVKGLDAGRDWYLLAGDLSALPAIAVQLERLADDAVGHCIVHVPDAEDARALSAPAGISIEWVVSERLDEMPRVVSGIPWREGSVGIWVAAEFTQMRTLRSYLLGARGIARDDLYISSYWKAGSSDEEHKVAKRELMNAG